MYGPISGSEWGKQSDTLYNFESDKFYDKTFEYLQETARENPILTRIKKREDNVKWYAETFAAKKTDVEEYRSSHATLEGRLEKEYEEKGRNSEHAKELQAAMNWRENSDEIEMLREELLTAEKAKRDLEWAKSDKEKGLYSANRTKAFEAMASLRWTIRRTIAQDEYGNWHKDWDEDYEFREEFESFLGDITYGRRCLRENLDDFETHELVQKYLENPLWHLPKITNFILVDLIDLDLIMIERSYYPGLFSPSITDEIGGLGAIFIPFLNILAASPCLSPKAKRERRKWRSKKFTIGLGLIYILIGSWDGKKITELLVSQGFPSWIFMVIWPITMLFFVLPPITNTLIEYINKRRIKYNSLCKQAYDLLNIRWDIYSGAYDAKTCIERLKKLDDQDLHISSLIYPLLELQLNSERSLPQDR